MVDRENDREPQENEISSNADTEVPIDLIEEYQEERLTEAPKTLDKITIDPQAIAEMLVHAERFFEPEGPRFLNREVVGLLIGVDLESNHLHINRVEAVAEGSPMAVRFKEEHYHVYEKLNLRKDVEYVVGWYHSHPNIGLFLSVTDIVTHALSFQLKNPRAVAIVLDPSSIPKKVNYGDITDFSEILGIFQIEDLSQYRHKPPRELLSFLNFEAMYYRIPWKPLRKDF